MEQEEKERRKIGNRRAQKKSVYLYGRRMERRKRGRMKRRKRKRRQKRKWSSRINKWKPMGRR